MTPPWVKYPFSIGREIPQSSVDLLPRPKQTASCYGLGNAAIDRTRLTRPRFCSPFTQGGAARLRRLALPWADIFHAFSVKNLQYRNVKKRRDG
jgi:hypothetical protein